VTKYLQQPQFSAPGPAFAVSAAAGKTVWLIPSTSQSLVAQQAMAGMKAAFTVVHVKTEEVSTDGTLSTYVSGMKTAVSQHAAAIVLVSVDPRQIAAQVKEAADAHIPVIWAYSEPGVGNVPNVAAQVPVNFPLMGKLEALKAIQDTDGNAHALVVWSSDVTTEPGMVTAIKQEFAADCPKCTIVSSQNVPLAQWATQIPQVARSVLVANPQINVALLVGDRMAEYVAPVLRETNLVGKVKIETSDATPSLLPLIPQGSVSSDGGAYQPWTGWAFADQTLRVLTNTAPLASENIPIALFDSTNIGPYASNAQNVDVDRFFGNSYEAGYESLWKES
jgi:ribose transport system substrate-binding protein